MDDDLKSYLADQSTANSSSDEDDPQSRDDPNPTDEDDDEELPEDGESPGDDDEDEDDGESSEQPASAGFDPRLAEIEARAAAAEQRALLLQNQIAIDREHARLQARWAQMDQEDADNERRELVNYLSNQQAEAVKNENLTLRQQLAQIDDLTNHKPKAIAYLAEAHGLTLAERKQLERINDPIIMASTAEMFAGARKDAQREARRAARAERLGGQQDRIGSSNGRTATQPPPSTGNELIDYLNQQKAELRRY